MLQFTLCLDTLADLRAAPVQDAQVILVLGASSAGDGLGGFYRWTPTATDAEDTVYYNVIASTANATGRWVRTFQRVRSISSNVLVNNGSFKTLFCPGTTDANGRVTVYLTTDGTATGAALFTTIMETAGEVTSPVASANDLAIGGRFSLSADLKTLTYQFGRGNSSVVSVLGVNVLGMRAVAQGTAVVVRVDGM